MFICFWYRTTEKTVIFADCLDDSVEADGTSIKYFELKFVT